MTTTTDSAVDILVAEPARRILPRLKGLFAEDPVRFHWESTLERVIERMDKAPMDGLLVRTTSDGPDIAEQFELLEVVLARAPELPVLLLRDGDGRRGPRKGPKGCRVAALPHSDAALRRLVRDTIGERTNWPMTRDEIRGPATMDQDQILGHSESMQRMYRQIRQAAASDIPVLIVGETGTGKDLAAQAIHLRSDRREGPFIPVHLGSLPQELVASELFGHERGSFTGALEQRTGQFEAANEGSIFLDEISTIDERVQVSLLRVIEQKRFTRLGGIATYTTDARIIAATNEDLDHLVDEGVFREDLLYRLDVFRLRMPPLREREGDVPLLAREFLARFTASFGKPVAGFTDECMAVLEQYNWPGNVRELKNVVQRAVLVAAGEEIGVLDLPARFRRGDAAAAPRVTFEVGVSLEHVEREMILRTLAVTRNRTRTAKILGISRKTLYNKMVKYGIEH